MIKEDLLEEFEKLSAKRKRLLDAIEENVAEGLLTQLTNIYPDEAHFIYELLQNAEDAEATEVNFYLHSKGLRFRHNGTVQFAIEHIEAITNYDRTTKKLSDNKIGKFGVGFKSVFSYTRKPIINSAGLTFSISRAILPKREMLTSEEEEIFKDGTTTFIFNFDEPTKLPDRAFKEVKQALEELDEKSLMFLSNIKKITITIRKDTPLQKIILSENIEPNICKFSIVVGEKIHERFYYLLVGKMPKVETNLLDEEARSKLSKLRIAISFKLEKVEQSFRIMPADDASVSVFFPAVKEISGLKFHIHAPFSSTPSRDVIKNSDENRIILKGIAHLLIENIDNFVDANLLDEYFLAAMPNSDDQLAPMYEIFRSEIMGLFNSGKNLIPSNDGTLISSYRAVSANTQFQNAIDGHFLDDFLNLQGKTSISDYRFIANMKNSRAQKFIQSLYITTLTFSKFKEILVSCQKTNKIKDLQNILSGLTTEKLKLFFCLFAQNSSLYWSEIRELSFIPVNSPKISYLSPTRAYLPSRKFNTQEVIVLSSLVNPLSQNLDAVDKMVLTGLQNLDISYLDDSAMLDIKLDQLKSRHVFGESAEIAQAKFSLEEIRELIVESRCDTEYLSQISSLCIYVGWDSEGHLIWTSLDRVFVDSPFEITGLKSVKKYLPIPNTTELWVEYSKIENFSTLLKSSKALNRIVPRKQVYSDGSSDWIVDKFEEMLENGDIEFARQIWNELISEENEDRRWEIKAERVGDRSRYSDSSFISALQFSKWLPDLKGERRRPKLMDKKSLHPSFVFLETKLVKAIKFDGASIEAFEAEKKRAAEREEKNALARELGFSDYSEVEDYRKLKELHPEILANLISSTESHFPEETVQDLEEKILETTRLMGNAAEVKIVEGIIRERKNYKSSHAEMKQYARAKYQIGNIMKCQACTLNMPFKLSDGNFYFEAVYLFKDLKKEFICNILALCPTCAAKYKYALETNLNLLKEEMMKGKIKGTGFIQFKIEMASSEYLLTFTDDHFLEIQTILLKAE